MIGARQILAQVLTVSAINAQIDALNTRFGSEFAHLPSSTDPAQNGVQDIWASNFTAITRPGIGYAVGILKAGRTELRRAGKNRMYVPVWIDCQSEPGELGPAFDQATLMFQALMYVMEAAELGPTALAGVTPPFQLVHITEPIGLEPFVGDAAASGKVFLLRSQWELVFDDVRS